ncbi:hypothetical protein EDC01DRAFT_663909 [Geopyxis carbonaria]|nr:hypothetical protein EDC01DRAFT_663909 [Geopyxis carbonaria]
MSLHIVVGARFGVGWVGQVLWTWAGFSCLCCFIWVEFVVFILSLLLFERGPVTGYTCVLSVLSIPSWRYIRLYTTLLLVERVYLLHLSFVAPKRAGYI